MPWGNMVVGGGLIVLGGFAFLAVVVLIALFPKIRLRGRKKGKRPALAFRLDMKPKDDLKTPDQK